MIEIKINDYDLVYGLKYISSKNCARDADTV